MGFFHLRDTGLVFYDADVLSNVVLRHSDKTCVGPTCSMTSSSLLYVTSAQDILDHRNRCIVKSLDCSISPPESKNVLTLNHYVHQLWCTMVNGSHNIFICPYFGSISVYDVQGEKLKWSLSVTRDMLSHDLKGHIRVERMTSGGQNKILLLDRGLGMLLLCSSDGEFKRIVWKEGERGIESIRDMCWNHKTSALIVSHKCDGKSYIVSLPLL